MGWRNPFLPSLLPSLQKITWVINQAVIGPVQPNWYPRLSVLDFASQSLAFKCHNWTSPTKRWRCISSFAKFRCLPRQSFAWP